MSNYFFTSKRLGFRKFRPDDLPIFAEMNANAEVMEFFPNALSTEESDGLANRINTHAEAHQYTYFATEIIDNQEFIGFIGLALQAYETPFCASPFTDIGWRLKKAAWGKGFATEGAKACLQYAFETIGLTEIYAAAMIGNENSEKVMQKIGMKKLGTFDHPNIEKGHPKRRCVFYQIKKGD